MKKQIIIWLLVAAVVVGCGEARAKTWVDASQQIRVRIDAMSYSSLDVFKVCIDGHQFLMARGGITQVWKYDWKMGTIPARCQGNSKETP